MADVPLEKWDEMAKKAGVRLSGETLVGNWHGPEPTDPEEGHDGSVGVGENQDYIYEHPDPILLLPYRDELRDALGPFQCCGVKAGARKVDWEDIWEYRPKTRRHEQACVGKAYVQIFTMLDWKNTQYDEVSVQCHECYPVQKTRDDAKKKNREKTKADEKDERKHQSKRRREEKQRKETEQLRKITTTTDPESADFIEKLKSLKGKQLISLCKANFLMVSGSKDQLVLRLVTCKKHGGGGECPTCGKAKIEIVFDEMGITPEAVTCKHMRGANKPCKFGVVVLTDEASAAQTAGQRIQRPGERRYRPGVRTR